MRRQADGDLSIVSVTIPISRPAGFLFTPGAELSTAAAAEAGVPSETSFAAALTPSTSSAAPVESELHHFKSPGIRFHPPLTPTSIPLQGLISAPGPPQS